MWGIIATWRMAVEGISKASQVLAEGGTLVTQSK